MKISVKTILGTVFQVEANPSDTIADVKRTIEMNKGSDEYPAELLLLIHAGQLLSDESTLEANGVSESNFLIVLKRKNNPAPAPSAQQPVPVPVPAPAQPAQTHEEAEPEPAPQNVPAEPVPALVQQILDMGGGCWDQETVVRALNAAFNNTDRAVEYLYMGIPGEAQAGVGGGDVAAQAAAQNEEVALTPGEMEAVGRLEAMMGVDRDRVMEVFFACNKNEDQAANYLLDHMDD